MRLLLGISGGGEEVAVTLAGCFIAAVDGLLITGPQAIDVGALHGDFMGGVPLRDREFRGRQLDPPLSQRRR